MDNVTIGINEFVKRQTKDSPYSYYDGTWDELADLAEICFDQAKVTQSKDGKARVILIPLCPEKFYTSVVQVDETTEFKTIFERRRPEEDPYVKTTAVGAKKLRAQYVNLVLYSHDALAENKEQSTNCDWEIISINCSNVEDEPMHPLTMARNFLEKTGGTKANYTAEQFAKAIWYWKDKISG